MLIKNENPNICDTGGCRVKKVFVQCILPAAISRSIHYYAFNLHLLLYFFGSYMGLNDSASETNRSLNERLLHHYKFVIHTKYRGVMRHNSQLNVTPKCHTSTSHLIKSTSQCHTSMSHLNVTPQWHALMPHLNITPQYHTSISYLSATLQCHTSISHLNVTPHCHTSLSHLNVTPHCHTSLSHLNVTTPRRGQRIIVH